MATIVSLDSRLLAQPPSMEQRWRDSRSTQLLMYRADVCGLIMVMLNNIMLVRRRNTINNSIPLATALGRTAVLAVKAFIPLAGLQLCLLHSHRRWYQAHRTHLAVANRLLRLLVHLLFGLDQQFNAVALFVAQQHSPLWVLLVLICAAPVLQVQGSVYFFVLTHVLWWLQPLHVAAAAFLSWNGPHHLAAQQHPAAQQVAALSSSVTCVLDAVFRGLLFVGSLGVSDAQLPHACFAQQAASCSSVSQQLQAHAQLLLFTNLMLSWFIPFYAAFMLELHSKLSFFQSQQLEVVPAPSLLLPLPQHPWLSHGIVLLAAPTVCWFAVQRLVPVLYL